MAQTAAGSQTGAIARRARSALEKTFDHAAVDTRSLDGGRILVRVIGRHFNRKDEATKQSEVWNVLRGVLDDADLLRIGLVLVFGTDELA
jgi:hypothetical protein